MLWFGLVWFGFFFFFFFFFLGCSPCASCEHNSSLCIFFKAPRTSRQGIGRATASRFAREGYNVVIAAREPSRVASAAEELAAATGARENAALGVPTDITDPAAVQRLVERVVDTYDSVDVVINCAGAPPTIISRIPCVETIQGLGCYVRRFAQPSGV